MTYGARFAVSVSMEELAGGGSVIDGLTCLVSKCPPTDFYYSLMVSGYKTALACGNL